MTDPWNGGAGWFTDAAGNVVRLALKSEEDERSGGPGGPVTTDDVSVEGTYSNFEGDDLTSVLNSIDLAFTEVGGALMDQGQGVSDVDPPEEATAEDVANTLNELLASLRDAGIIAATS